MRRELNVVFSYIRDAMFLSGTPSASRAWAVLGPVIGPATFAATGLGRLHYTLPLIWVLTMLGSVNPFLYFRSAPGISARLRSS